MGKVNSKTKSKEMSKEVLIGAGVTLLIVIGTSIFYIGSLNEKINHLSDKITELEINNKKLSSGLTLTNSILTRVLNHINISENEKTAIYNEINKTITETSNSATLMTSTENQAVMNYGSQEQANTAEPEYMKKLIRWSKNIKQSADHLPHQ